MTKKLATTTVVLLVVSTVYAAAYLATCPKGAGIRRAPWFDVVERKSKVGEGCLVVFAPCIWVEQLWLVTGNIKRAEGDWVTRDGEHSLQIRRVWGNTFELSSRTGWLEQPVRATGKSPGCGPMVVTESGVTLLLSSTKSQLSVTIDGKRGVFSGPL